jgi:myo-inositol 2-dehydrogenase/D-chiro-inositol 1-dehydrogenase
MKSNLSRRQLIKNAAGLCVGSFAIPYFVPSSVLGKEGSTAPSNRIGLGFIGTGMRGMAHVKGMCYNPNIEILGVSDTFKSRMDAATQHIQNKTKATTCKQYADFQELLACKDIDAVFISSTTQWHGLHMALAAKAGKDIYGEKELTRTVAEGIEVCRTVRKHQRVFQVGTQQRSSIYFRLACQLALNGYLGKLHTIRVSVPGGRSVPKAPAIAVPEGFDYKMWQGPAPLAPYNEFRVNKDGWGWSHPWYHIRDYCVGWIAAWGVHHLDIAQWGAPSLINGIVEVKGTGQGPAENSQSDALVGWEAELTTQDGIRVIFTDNKKYEQGCRFEGDKGWAHVTRGNIKTEPGDLRRTKFPDSDTLLYKSKHHTDNFIECVKSREDPVSNVESGHTATTLANICDIAIRLKRTLKWDWSKQQFVNDAEANKMLASSFNNGWTW